MDKVGIRAARVNEIWHIDVTTVVLADKSKVYIQAILDNYSRYVLAWHVSQKLLWHKDDQLDNQSAEAGL